MEKKAENPLDHLKTLISISSPSGGELETLHYIEEVLSSSGFSTEYSEVPGKHPNLIAKRGEAKFAISTHADHVILDKESKCVIKGDFAIGPGVADTKGQIAALLYAVQQTADPVNIIITVDEEKEGSGSRALNLKGFVESVLVLEPTDFRICTHQAGAIEVRLTIRTESFHASCSNANLNPILKSAELLAEIKRLRENSRHVKKWNLPPLTPIFVCSGNDDLYASPESLQMHLDLAVAPEENPTEIFSLITELAGRHGFQIDWAEVEPGFTFPSSSSILSRAEKAYLKTFGKRPKTDIMPSWTDAANFALSGVDTLVFGAGSLKHCHTQREFLRISDLEKLSSFLKNFIEASA